MGERIKKRLPLLLGLTTVIFALDQLTKIWILRHLELHQAIVVVERFFHIVHVRNTGAAFGFLANSSFGPMVLTVISFLAIPCILFYYFFIQDENILSRIALAMVFAGALGNLTDRMRLGYVVDFIDWHYDHVYHWPAFNIADSSISIAIGLLIIDFFRDMREKRVTN